MKNYLFLFGFLLLVGCASQPEGASPEAPSEPVAEKTARNVSQVETLTLVPQRFVETLELPATVKSLQDAQVAAQVSGRVEWLKPLGSRVRKGDLIARLDDAVYRAAYQLARVQFDLAQDTYRRQEALYRDSVISEIEFTRAKAQRDQAKAQLDQAEEQLNYTRVRAPFAGRIETHFLEVGELAAPGTPLLRIVNNLSVELVAGVPERYALDIVPGTPVTVRFSAYNGLERKARVTFVSNVIDPASRTFEVKIRLDNPEGVLKPDMVADLVLQVRTYEGALVLPQAAVLFDEEGPYVYVVEEQEGTPVARRRRIVTGPASGDLVLVREGLRAGEEVIIVGQGGLGDGEPVEVVRRHSAAQPL